MREVGTFGMSARKGYKFGIEWIALNDEAADGADVNEIRYYISTALLADLFGKTTEEVAEAVASWRVEAEKRIASCFAPTDRE